MTAYFRVNLLPGVGSPKNGELLAAFYGCAIFPFPDFKVGTLEYLGKSRKIEKFGKYLPRGHFMGPNPGKWGILKPCSTRGIII